MCVGCCCFMSFLFVCISYFCLIYIMLVKCAWMWCDLFYFVFTLPGNFARFSFERCECVWFWIYFFSLVYEKLYYFLELFLQKRVFDVVLNRVASWILMFFNPFLFRYSVGQSFHYQSAACARVCVWTLSELNERESSSIYGKTSGVCVCVWSCFKLYTNLVVAVRANCSCCCDSTFSFPPFSIFLYRCTQRKIRLTIILRNYIAFLCGFSLLALFLKLNNFYLIFSFVLWLNFSKVLPIWKNFKWFLGRGGKISTAFL